MEFVADFHIHSRYSRATSHDMDLPHLAKWARYKGITLLGTGDFTHHLWLEELKRYLHPEEDKGLFSFEGVYFILSGEVANIFSQNGKGYRVHNMILLPTFKLAEEVNKMLSYYGNLASDGRPILGMSCKALAKELFNISQDIMLIPSHIWTPWFSVFGSNSGFNSLEEAFDTYTSNLTALETGLSSDPPMNWRLSKLDRFSLVSNSDAHSPSRIGREANVFNCELNYWEIKRVLEKKDKEKFLYTIEFFPEEGKYHYDGHRNCNIRLHPKETKSYKDRCPVCGKFLTRGVLNRVIELADREEGVIPQNSISYKSFVPLDEIIAEAKGVDKKSKAIEKEYLSIVSELGSEFNILVKLKEEELFSRLNYRVAEGIKRVREGKLKILPGFDGEYGIIKIFDEEEKKIEQLTFF
ncbi:MAG: endonuclease Q family protein [Candidatus Omnitrophica bacterium]|nr:endonuclease Q family protein [Candidatus Omnitrophota bacterium]MCM8823513.1 endonuclease Q family protein [Candidatus Omnitrophota bacterium]MCM8825927.1 endonuclease Q family protein [Candidatus Omnitrophota bacterium]